jgi:hypothetical protein
MKSYLLFAYIGPGLGAGAIAAVMGMFAGLSFLFISFLWYPVKKFICWIRRRK